MVLQNLRMEKSTSFVMRRLRLKHNANFSVIEQMLRYWLLAGLSSFCSCVFILLLAHCPCEMRDNERRSEEWEASFIGHADIGHIHELLGTLGFLGQRIPLASTYTSGVGDVRSSPTIFVDVCSKVSKNSLASWIHGSSVMANS